MQMDGPLGMQAFIPRGRGGKGQGSKPRLTPCLGTERDPERSAALAALAAAAACIMQFVQLKQQPGWQGRAGEPGCLCSFSCLPCQADVACKKVAVQLARASRRHTAESGELF